VVTAGTVLVLSGPDDETADSKDTIGHTSPSRGRYGAYLTEIRWLVQRRAGAIRGNLSRDRDGDRDGNVGCGRAGQFFSFEDAELDPDMVLLSKSIGGLGLPMSLLLLKPEIDQWKPGEHNGTFRGNNHAFVTATASLEQYWQNPAFAESERAKGDHLGFRLQALVERFSPHLVDVRGRGMMRGVRCAEEPRYCRGPCGSEAPCIREPYGNQGVPRNVRDFPRCGSA